MRVWATHTKTFPGHGRSSSSNLVDRTRVPVITPGTPQANGGIPREPEGAADWTVASPTGPPQARQRKEADHEVPGGERDNTENAPLASSGDGGPAVRSDRRARSGPLSRRCSGSP